MAKQPVEGDQVQGNAHELEVDTDADFLVFACYITESVVLRKKVDLEQTAIEDLRERLVYAYLNFCEL